MNAGEKIAQTFPRVKWTGQSVIHRSLAGRMMVTGVDPDASVPKVVEVVYHAKLGFSLFDFLTERFHQFNWQVSADEFNALIIQDVHRHLTGQGDTKTPTKIRNPRTGNVFHKLATLDDLVGGVRIWHNSGADFGFRFRIAALTKEDGDVPASARVKAVAAMKEAQEVLASFEIAEPSIEEEQKIRQRVHVG